jgi:hypothetical protein
VVLKSKIIKRKWSKISFSLYSNKFFNIFVIYTKCYIYTLFSKKSVKNPQNCDLSLGPPLDILQELVLEIVSICLNLIKQFFGKIDEPESAKSSIQEKIQYTLQSLPRHLNRPTQYL